MEVSYPYSLDDITVPPVWVDGFGEKYDPLNANRAYRHPEHARMVEVAVRVKNTTTNEYISGRSLAIYTKVEVELERFGQRELPKVKGAIYRLICVWHERIKGGGEDAMRCVKCNVLNYSFIFRDHPHRAEDLLYPSLPGCPVQEHHSRLSFVYNEHAIESEREAPGTDDQWRHSAPC